VLRRPALHWVRGAGAERCIDPRSLALAVEELVGPVLVRAPEAENAVQGYVESTPGGHGLRVHLKVLDAGGTGVGERVLEHPGRDCPALTPAIVFVIAMMIDPGVAAHGLPPGIVALLTSELPEEALLNELEGGEARAPEPPGLPSFSEPEVDDESAPRAPVKRPPAVGRKSSEESEPRAEGPERERLGVQAAVLVRVSLREAPRPLWSGEERMLFDLGGPLSLVAHVRGGTQQGDFEFKPDRFLRLAVLAAGVLVCAGQRADAFLRLHGCLGAELAGALARGAGLQEGQTPFRGDVGVLAELSARLRIRKSWGVTAVVDGRLNLAKRRILYREGQEDRVAYEIPRLSVGFALGPSYEF